MNSSTDKKIVTKPFLAGKNFCEQMPLRIGMLMDHPSPHMVALLDAVAAGNDCSLEVLYCGQSAPGRNWGSPVGRVPHRFVKGYTGPLGMQFNPGILRAMNRLHVDVWVVNTIYGSLTTLMASWWLRFRNKPWVYMNEPVRPRSGLHALMKELPLRFILDRAGGIISTGRAAVEMYRRRMKRDCSYESVPYFIGLNEFSGLHDPTAPSVGYDLQFVTSCQMIERKGVDCLLQACRNLPGSGWHLTLIGDGPLKSKFEREFASLISSGRINFTGAVPYNSRAAAFTGKHVFILPSRWDGWGMVLPEALAAGLPVISTDQVMSGLEFLKDGENGFIVPAGVSQPLADKMQWFINNVSLLPRMSAAARKSVENYKSDIGAETFVNYLRRLDPGIAQDRTRIPPDPARTNWRLLTTPKRTIDKTKLRLRRFAKAAVIRGITAVRRSGKAKGHLIVAYHLVLKEDREKFEDHIKFYRDHFRISSLGELLHASASGNQDEFRLAITFDDGFRILMQDCLEILGKYGIKAGFYVPAAFVEFGGRDGKAADLSSRVHYYNYPLEPMSPDDLKKLTVLGHEVGSHGLFHENLHSLTPEYAERELAVSRSMISGWTGVAVNGFAYPYGETSSSLGNPADWLRRTGFTYGLTLTRGSVDSSSDSFLLPRHHVEGNWTIRDLRCFLLA